MRVVPDYVYKFTMRNDFRILDGIYLVSAVFSYPEILTGNIDLSSSTYLPYGVSSEQYVEDLNLIKTGQIFKITSVEDAGVVIFIPECIISGIPDGSIRKLYRMGLAIDLGIFDDPEDLISFKHDIEQIVAATMGDPKSAVIYTVSNKWMTSIDYSFIESNRENLKSRVSNNYTDKLALEKVVDSLKTRLKYCEDLLKRIR